MCMDPSMHMVGGAPCGRRDGSGRRPFLDAIGYYQPAGGGDDGHRMSLDEIFHANVFIRTVGQKATFMEIGLGRLEDISASQGFNENRSLRRKIRLEFVLDWLE